MVTLDFLAQKAILFTHKISSLCLVKLVKAKAKVKLISSTSLCYNFSEKVMGYTYIRPLHNHESAVVSIFSRVHQLRNI